MVNTIQNIEIYHTLTSNYLLIHKNACSQVLTTLQNNFTKVKRFETLPNQNPYWTIIRDPYNRFISGLTYDILINYGNLNSLDKILNLKKIKPLLFSKLNKNYRSTGFISHTLSQWTYIFNQPLNFFVNINDTTPFLDLHYPKPITDSNIMEKKYKDIVKEYINSNTSLKQLIHNLLVPDYFLYDHIQTQGLLWNWQMGKMF